VVLKTGIATVLRGTTTAQGPPMLRVQTQIRRREEVKSIGAPIKPSQLTKEANGVRHQVRCGRSLLLAHLPASPISSTENAQRCRVHTQSEFRAVMKRLGSVGRSTGARIFTDSAKSSITMHGSTDESTNGYCRQYSTTELNLVQHRTRVKSI
jgi:hypothetical protein